MLGLIKKSCVVLLVLLLFVVDGAAVMAQTGSPVSAELSDTLVTTDDRFVLTITVQGAPDRTPELPTLEKMRVVGTSSSSQTTIINNVISSQAVFFFTMRAVEAGVFTIDPITILIEGVQYQTQPLTITVEEGIASVQPDVGDTVVPPGELIDQDFYVEAFVDNEQPYLGQQISYVFRFYQALELRDRPTYTAPDFIGFWNPQETQQTQTLAPINGKTYRVTELSSPLFPTVPGDRDIEASELELPQGQTFLTEALTLDVRDLPQPAPDGFNGATGQYRISAEIENTEINVNDPVTLRVRLAGFGNIETLPDPIWPEIDGWRAFENRSVVNTQFENGVLSGNRTYERIYIPSEPGEYTFPSVQYVYFDPQTEQYETTETGEFPIRVVGSVGVSAEPVANNPETLESNDPIAAIKETPSRLSGAPTSLLNQNWFWALWIVPLLALIADGTRRWVQRKRADVDPEQQRQARAMRTARKALKEAKTADPRVNISGILSTYFGDKWREPMGGLTKEVREAKMIERGVSPELVEQVSTVYQRSEEIVYSGDSAEAYAQIIDEAERMLAVIDKEVRT